jgi:hemoglobin
VWPDRQAAPSEHIQAFVGLSGMKESHEKLNISEAEWNAMVTDFKATLAKFKVPQREQQELITIVSSTKNDIVRSSASGSRQ